MLKRIFQRCQAIWHRRCTELPAGSEKLRRTYETTLLIRRQLLDRADANIENLFIIVLDFLRRNTAPELGIGVTRDHKSNGAELDITTAFGHIRVQSTGGEGFFICLDRQNTCGVDLSDTVEIIGRWLAEQVKLR